MKLITPVIFFVACMVCIVSLCCNEKSKTESHKTSNVPDTSKVMSIEEAKRVGYNDQVCLFYMDMARYHTDQGNSDSSRYYYEIAGEYCNKPVFDKTLPAAYLYEYGAFYHALRADYVAANKAYYDALQYLKANGLAKNKLTIGVYILLQGTQEELGHHDQALMYLKEAEKLAHELRSEAGIAGVWSNLGDYYSKRNINDSALYYFDKALEKYDPSWDPNILSSALIGKGMVLTETGKPELAIPVLERSLQFAKENQVIYSIEASMIALAGAYNKMGRYRDALSIMTGALMAQDVGINFGKEEAYKVLTETYEGIGDHKRALLFQRKLNDWQDSLDNIRKTNALNEMELKFQTANKDKEIASKGLVIEKQKNTLSRKNELIAGVIGLALIAVLVLTVLYRNAKHKQMIQELELKTLQNQQEIAILRSTMQGEEQERRRIARELHDGIGSMLASATMHISLLKKRDPSSITPKEFDHLFQLLQETGSEVRKTAQNITPDVLYKQSLNDAIRNYCESIGAAAGVSIDVQFYGENEEFAPHCKLVIYRVVQELVHNIIKHANADRAIVQAVSSEGNFSITVEDNGSGFDTRTGSQGMGLKNVEARVKSLGGSMQIDSEIGKGTTVYVEFECKSLLQN